MLKTLIDFDAASDDDEPVRQAPKRIEPDSRGFATSIDLMASLFGQTKSPTKAKVAKGFEVRLRNAM